ncbi:hypothetical protein FCV25MIE_01025 [Fagus crenata]
MVNSWRFTGFYGFAETHRHHESWDLLRLLHQQSSLPWCCVGDYNELTSIDEKVGGGIRSERQMQDFRDAIDSCGFIDLGFVGEPFTWCNNRLGSATIWERLDRGLATEEWMSLFPHASLHHIDNGTSDHCPLCKNHFANISRELIKKKACLKEAESLSRRGGDHSRAKALKHEVTLLYGREEKMWRQRSRNNWLRCGDRNTRFFHHSASQRRRQNFIECLQDNNGVIQTGDSGVAAIFLQYFQDLFKTTGPINLAPILSGVSCVVTKEMNETLGKDFTAAEVAFALKQMTPTSAPGPDGMPPLFYQTFWDSIAINHTYITLIPKTQSPTNVTEFRPISLCNVVYKLIAKVLANRLKKILPSIISETQSAFVPGRLITDNILVAFESLHHMSTQRHGRTGHMALKLDMSKAYDRVEWTYLEAIMLKMGFQTPWVNLIMECVRSVSFSILVNGSPHGYFSPSRGLRQGDPLSPYLFLLCTEDDCLLFCKANTSECDTILQILDSYEYASGQQLNRSKTTLFFSKCVAQSTQDELIRILGVPVVRQLIRQFWWGHGENQKKVHWVCWNKMCQPKSRGGLGFRDLKLFNEALLGKQIWRLLHCRSSLFYRVFKAKFFPDCSILDSRIWGDIWLAGSTTGKIHSPRHYFPEGATVSCLINQEQHEWKTQLIQHIFLPHEASSILGIPLSSHDSSDTFIWPHTSSGRYSVRSAYHILMESAIRDRPSHSNMDEESSLWKSIWSLKVIPRIKAPTPSNIKWSPPRVHRRKINFDGAIFTDLNAAGIGVIVRDSAGNPVAALSKRLACRPSPAIIEALAALEAVKFAKYLGLSEVEFEGDASVIIAALEDSSDNLTPYGNIISDTKVEVGSLQWFSFSHVNRKANEVAHVLARKAKDIVDSFIWTQFMPPDVIHVLLKDSFNQ